ncbi:MAG: HAMP domain-containing protein [Proteobacteria bacterium]|nr:HAMP domain-containing protein [Pseudomonadota bacterium]
MKPRRLFTKIYLTFLGVMLAVNLIVFLLYHVIEGGQYEGEAQMHLEAVRHLVATQLDGETGISPTTRDKIAALLKAISGPLNTHYWIADLDGNILMTTYPGQTPESVASLMRKWTAGEHIRHVIFDPDVDVYGSASIPWPSGPPIRLHFTYEEPRSHAHHLVFGVGLVLIFVLVGALSIPLSRSITRPVTELHESAHRIAAGDLDHRAVVTTRDEIGDMGGAFNQMADSLSKMIKSGRDLLTNVSHELRSPLARIRVAQELIQDRLRQRGDAGVDRYLEEMEREVEEMDLLVGKILLLSKRDLTDTRPRPEEFDLAAMVKDQLDRMNSLFQARNLTVQADLPAQCLVKGDRDALGLAVSNVLDNMGRYANDGGVAGVSLARENDWTILRFFNTTPRLSEDELQRMFLPFQRLSKARGQGTGLGLAIAKRTLESVGWSIKAENINNGLCLTISGPV